MLDVIIGSDVIFSYTILNRNNLCISNNCFFISWNTLNCWIL